MVMGVKDDNINSYIKSHKQDIPDNGFSAKMLKQLPENTKPAYIIGLFTYIGITLSLVLAFYSGVFAKVAELITSVPIYYYLIGIGVLPLPFLIYLLLNSAKVKPGLI